MEYPIPQYPVARMVRATTKSTSWCRDSLFGHAPPSLRAETSLRTRGVTKEKSGGEARIGEGGIGDCVEDGEEDVWREGFCGVWEKSPFFSFPGAAVFCGRGSGENFAMCKDATSPEGRRLSHIKMSFRAFVVT